MVTRRAFTIIELLVVMAIIAVLAGFIVAGIPAVRRQTLRTKTEAILAGVRAALAVAAADRGGSLAPVEHPLAGSAEPRPAFVRADGGPVETAGEALLVGDPAWVDAGARSRVLRGDDRYVGGSSPGDCELPLLYGLPRSRIGVLGAAHPGITRLRRLPKPRTGYDDPDHPGMLASPYDATRYPDELFLVSPALPAGTTPDAAASQAVDYALAANRAELLQLGAIRAEADAPLIMGDRVRVASDHVDPRWQPGDVRDGGAWKPYRLRGAAVYDAWGREILFSLGANDAMRIESAGPDGVFRWDPGPDGVLQTPADATEPVGDDRDGARDNLGAVTGG